MMREEFPACDTQPESNDTMDMNRRMGRFPFHIHPACRMHSLIVLATLGCVAGSVTFSQQIQPAAPTATGAAPASTPAEEDWGKLAVDREVMPHLMFGMLQATDQTDTFTRELRRVEWRPGDPIDLWVIRPNGVAKPKVVLYLYSYPSDTSRFRDDRWCQRAVSHGLAAVGFVSALTGQRFANRPMREWFVNQLEEAMGSSTHDVQLIIDYLQTRGDLSTDHVAMFGQGSGASIAILAASVDPRIDTLDLLNPWGDWPDWLKTSPVVPDAERATYLAPEFLAKAALVEPMTQLPRLEGRRLRVQQILDDPDNPPAARDKMAQAVPAGDLVQFKDRQAHERAWMANGLTGWLAQQLGAQPAAGTSGTASLHPQAGNP
jgi:hypothetical protein